MQLAPQLAHEVATAVEHLFQAGVAASHVDRHGHLLAYYDSLMDGPVRVLEQELSHDLFDERATDDWWWEQRRPLYVKLYRIVKQLNTQLEWFCIENDIDQQRASTRLQSTETLRISTYIRLPPCREEEQYVVEREGEREADIEPNVRVMGEGGFRRFFAPFTLPDDPEGEEVSNATITTWPPPLLIASLMAAERASWESKPDAMLSRLRFSLGTRVWARMKNLEVSDIGAWVPGFVCERLYIFADSDLIKEQPKPYAICLDIEACGNPKCQNNFIVFAPADDDESICEVHPVTGQCASDVAFSIPSKAALEDIC